MILHQFPGGDGIGSISPPCLKVELALRLLGLEYRLKNHRSMNAVRKFSPTGRLPVLEIDGEYIADSIVILDRLEELRPEGNLCPSTEQKKVRDRLWEHLFNDHLYWYGFYLRWVHPENQSRFMDALLGGLPFPARPIARWSLGRQQVRRARIQGTGGKTPDEAHGMLERALAMADAGLEDGPFLQGRDRPGRGDLALASIAVQCGFRETMPDATAILQSHPGILGLIEAVYAACDLAMPRWWK